MADTWQTIEQAAVTLGLSVRTVNRHISSGKLASRLTDGRREVLISAPDPQPEPDALKEAVRDAFQRLNALAADSLADAAAGGAEDEPQFVTPDFAPEYTSDLMSDTADVVATEHSPFAAPEPAPFAGREAAPYAAPDQGESATPRPEPDPQFDRAPEPERAYGAGSYLGHSAVSRAGGLDAQTVLALADSASDKAELAVSAYQTLARVAEMRMETTRRSARVAWLAVALMAAGVTVAVGWTSHHLTRARTEADLLRQQVTVTSATADTVSQERDRLRGDLSAAREAAARAEGSLEAAQQAQAKLEAEVKENVASKNVAATKPAPKSFLERWAALWTEE